MREDSKEQTRQRSKQDSEEKQMAVEYYVVRWLYGNENKWSRGSSGDASLGRASRQPSGDSSTAIGKVSKMCNTAAGAMDCASWVSGQGWSRSMGVRGSSLGKLSSSQSPDGG